MVYGDGRHGPNGYKSNAYLSSRTSCDCFYDFIYNIHAPSQSINVILSSYIQIKRCDASRIGICWLVNNLVTNDSFACGVCLLTLP